jgi:predicted ABC-type ATPase
MKKKKLVSVGGANGVGKTTFAYQYRDDFDVKYLGADEIAAEISKKGFIGNVEIKAGKEFFHRLDVFLESGESIIIESTLSGTGLAKKIRGFKTAGYSIHLIYVFLTESSICKKRISFRTKKGGHFVPDADVERRFSRSVRNFWNIYKELADTWQIFYNGFERPVEVAISEKGEEMVLDSSLFKKLKEITK